MLMIWGLFERIWKEGLRVKATIDNLRHESTCVLIEIKLESMKNKEPAEKTKNTHQQPGKTYLLCPKNKHTRTQQICIYATINDNKFRFHI